MNHQLGMRPKVALTALSLLALVPWAQLYQFEWDDYRICDWESKQLAYHYHLEIGKLEKGLSRGDPDPSRPPRTGNEGETETETETNRNRKKALSPLEQYYVDSAIEQRLDMIALMRGKQIYISKNCPHLAVFKGVSQVRAELEAEEEKLKSRSGLQRLGDLFSVDSYVKTRDNRRMCSKLTKYCLQLDKQPPAFQKIIRNLHHTIANLGLDIQELANNQQAPEERAKHREPGPAPESERQQSDEVGKVEQKSVRFLTPEEELKPSSESESERQQSEKVGTVDLKISRFLTPDGEFKRLHKDVIDKFLEPETVADQAITGGHKQPRKLKGSDRWKKIYKMVEDLSLAQDRLDLILAQREVWRSNALKGQF